MKSIILVAFLLSAPFVAAQVPNYQYQQYEPSQQYQPSQQHPQYQEYQPNEPSRPVNPGQQAIHVCGMHILGNFFAIHSIRNEFENKQYGEAIHSVINTLPAIEKTTNECSKITKEDLKTHLFNHLNEEQKECLSVFQNSFIPKIVRLIRDEKDSNWATPFRTIHEIVDNLEQLKTSCPPSLVKSLFHH